MPPLSAALRSVQRDMAETDPCGADRPSEPLRDQIDALQQEMDALKAELNLLRHRDETLNFCMHRIDEELRLAAKLQQDFLPRVLPQVGNVHFQTIYRPAGYVSGDLYDVCRLDEQHIGFWMADAVGHGMPAALLTMFIKNAFVTKEIHPGGYRLLSPGETLGRLNDAMVEQDLSQATFATAVYGIINTNTLVVQHARAGHPLPLMLRCCGKTESLDADGGLLGIFPGQEFETKTTRLSPGDRLIFYSDGVEVAYSDSAADTHRWQSEIIARRNLSTQQMLAEFTASMDAAAGSLQPKDDLTLITVDVR